MKRSPPPIRPLSTAAADQTQRQNPTVLQRAEGSNVCAEIRPSWVCVATEHFSIQRSVGENAFFSQEAESNTKRWLFSVKQRAESDLGNSHQTSSCSWVIWRGDRVRRRVTAALSGLFLFSVHAAFDASHIMARTKLIKSLRGNPHVLVLCLSARVQQTVHTIHHKERRTLIYSSWIFQLHPPRQKEQ